MNRLLLVLLALLGNNFFHFEQCQAENSHILSLRYIEDAERFCTVFSPKTWEEMKKKYQGAELMDEFMKRLDTAVKTPEFEAIMDKQHTLKKDPEILYQHYVNNVTALTGATFSCPDLKIYFQETLKY